VHSETWRAQCAQPVRRGDRLRVIAIDGLLLQVQHINEEA
jgi:membrane-bound serine protease (ClpP class)